MLFTMRVEPRGTDSIVHVVQRGVRGSDIVQDDADRLRFARLLYHANDEFRDEYWERSTKELGAFERCPQWPERKEITQVLAWTLMSNHFHLILKEIRPGGITKFMQKINGSMSTHFNKKYGLKGSLFQGSYKSRTADLHGDLYLKYLFVYVLVKNPLEMRSSVLQISDAHLNEGFDWGANYPFCSLGEFLGQRHPHISRVSALNDLFETSEHFKDFAVETLRHRREMMKDFER
jgi:hypothetical protein